MRTIVESIRYTSESHAICGARFSDQIVSSATLCVVYRPDAGSETSVSSIKAFTVELPDGLYAIYYSWDEQETSLLSFRKVGPRTEHTFLDSRESDN